MPLVARQPQRSEYSDLHTHFQAFTISGRISMSAGQVSAGFLFWGATPTDYPSEGEKTPLLGIGEFSRFIHNAKRL